MRARSAIGLGLLCVGLGACDADLEDLRVLVWQPAQLASGSGDVLDDAAALTVHLSVDGVPQSFSLQEGRSVTGRLAAPTGSEVQVVLTTRGTSLADAFGRSGLVRLEPGDGAVEVTVVLAPTAGIHRLSDGLPDARDGLASCGAPDGRVWLVGGNRGGGLVAGSFVIDPRARDVLEGPGLAADRTRASCVWDGARGVYLLGGCALDGTPAGGLLHAPTGELGEAFTERAVLAEAGCGSRLVRTASGVVFACTGDRLVRFAPSTSEETPLPLATARFSARAAAVGESVLLAGGFTDDASSTPVANLTLVRTGPDGIDDEVELSFEVSALGDSDSAGVLAVIGDDVVRIQADGGRDIVANSVVPAAFNPAAVSAAGESGAAVLAGDGSELLVVDSAGLDRLIPVSPARPGGALHADPGGAVRIVGGGQPGVHVIVVD